VKARIGQPLPFDPNLDRERFRTDIRYRLRVFSERSAAQRTVLRWPLLVGGLAFLAMALSAE
jgi:hypothetical protein